MGRKNRGSRSLHILSSVVTALGHQQVTALGHQQVTAGPHGEYELRTFLLAPTAPTSLKHRRSIR